LATDALVSINMPCYRQLDRARRAVESVLQQSFGDFELTLFDDDASDEYRDYVESIADDRVRYYRNPSRLGAMNNIFHGVRAGNGKYSLAFHEDDLLGRHYLAAAVQILEHDATCGFVAAEIHEFEEEPTERDLARSDVSPVPVTYGAAADFLRAMFRGMEPMFGSVVYRRAALAGVTPDLDAYATLADRPFLLSILGRWSCVVIREAPLAWYRKHGNDDRHLAMSEDHILRLFETYRATLPQPLTAEDESLFYSYTGYWLLTLFDLVAPDRRTSLRQFMFRAVGKRLYDLASLKRSGRKRFLSRLVLNS
jgi:glycosyltransferase involved in cell wall biosynthesis